MNGHYEPGDTVLGNWTLTRLIGEGSYGRVFEARREDFGHTYLAAVKIISIPQTQAEVESVMSDGMDDESVTSYFRGIVEEISDEFALMSRLKGHDNIVSYEDHTVVPHTEGIGWDIFIRMELLTPLLEYERSHAVKKSDVIKLGVDMCKALELCGRYNVVHRDIKPENIFISDVGDFKLGDFGIARTIEKTTDGLSKKGTYTYMAPEVYRGEAYSANVDIYSLGIVLYRMLNENRSPFLPAYPAPITHTDRENALVRRISGTPLPAPKNADGRLAEIVLKACASNPAERFETPALMRRELEMLLEDSGSEQAAVLSQVKAQTAEKTPSVPETAPLPSAAAAGSAGIPSDRTAVLPTSGPAPAEEDKTVSLFSGVGGPRTETLFGDVPMDRTQGFAENRADAPVQYNPYPLPQETPPARAKSKKRLALIFALLAVSICAIAIPFYIQSQYMRFADSAVGDAIAQKLGVSSERVHEKDLATITSLDLSDMGISDITDLQYCTGLKELRLGDNHISDISNLSKLTKLETLSLAGNQVSDLSALQNLKALKTLSFNNNKVQNISVLKDLPALENVYLLCNPISSVDSIKALSCKTDVPLTDDNGNPLTSMDANSINYQTDQYRHSTKHYSNGTFTGTSVYIMDMYEIMQHTYYDADNNILVQTRWTSQGTDLCRYLYNNSGKITTEQYIRGDRLDDMHLLQQYFDLESTSEITGISPASACNTFTYQYDGNAKFVNKSCPVESVDWDFSDDTVSFGSKECSWIELSETLYQCSSFNYTYQIKEIDSGDPYGIFDIYVKDASGSWLRVDRISIPDGDEVSGTVYLSYPIEVTGIVFLPTAEDNYSFTSSSSVNNFVIGSNDYIDF